uniref:Multiple inositol polyphosphate phosphatase 1 n=1 Tax=Corethrella appendiculata TaxID=1370023 RepID=U5EQ88_9DIPT
MHIFMLFIFILINLIYCESKLCAQNIGELVLAKLATKTPYRHVQNEDTTEIKFTDCTPTKIWGLMRHGTRNPSRKVIRRMYSDLVHIRNSFIENDDLQLCEEDIEAFKQWRPILSEDEQKILVDEGVDELFELGQRYKKRLPYLLSQSYNENLFKFKFTKTERAQRSAENFVTALFDSNVARNINYPEPLSRDPVLRFYKLCERWKVDVDKNPASMKEFDRFKNGPEMRKVITKFSRKLATFVNADDIHLMYTTCAFETAWFKDKISPWCTLFDEHSIHVLEFLEDLEYYWIDGYGYSLTYKQACSAFTDLIKHFDEGSTEKNITFYFTHSGTLLKSLAFLNLYKDAQLTHKDFEVNRKWRTSKIDAFATNLIFILFECSNGPQVLLLHQEQPVHIPGCPEGQQLCPYEIFKEIHEDSLNNCKFEEMCSLNMTKKDEL